MVKKDFAKVAVKDPQGLINPAPNTLDTVFGTSNFYTPFTAAQEAYESLKAKQAHPAASKGPS